MFNLSCRACFVFLQCCVAKCLVGSAKGMFINSLSAVRLCKLHQSAWLIHYGLTAYKPWLSISYTIHKVSSKISLLHTKHKLRAPLICSCTVILNSCNTLIWFVSNLQTQHLRAQLKAGMCPNLIQTSWMCYSCYIKSSLLVIVLLSIITSQ